VLFLAVSILLIVAFDASVTRLVQLHPRRLLSFRSRGRHGQALEAAHIFTQARGITRPRHQRLARRSRSCRHRGLTKFSHGAWLVIIAVQLRRDGRDPPALPAPRRPDGPGARGCASSRVPPEVLVSRLHAPAMQAIAFARLARPPRAIRDRPQRHRVAAGTPGRRDPVPLVCLGRPTRPGPAVLDHVRHAAREPATSSPSTSSTSSALVGRCCTTRAPSAPRAAPAPPRHRDLGPLRMHDAVDERALESAVR
jgi:hypothetical protein